MASSSLLSLLCLLYFVGACSFEWNVTSDVSVNGSTRSYHLLFPENKRLDRHPAILMFHGYNSNASLFALEGTMARTGSSSGYLMVYLDGTVLLGKDNLRVWNTGSDYGTSATGYPSKHDDIAFVNAVIDAIVELYHADPVRIFVAGLSNGGSMALRVSCELAHRLAGAAIAQGSLEFRDATSCAENCSLALVSDYLSCSWSNKKPSCEHESWTQQLPELYHCSSSASQGLPRIIFNGLDNSWNDGGVLLGLDGVTSEGNYPPWSFTESFLIELSHCQGSFTSYKNGTTTDHSRCKTFTECLSSNLTICASTGGDWWYGPMYDIVRPCLAKGGTPESCKPDAQYETYGRFAHSIDFSKQILGFFNQTQSSQTDFLV